MSSVDTMLDDAAAPAVAEETGPSAGERAASGVPAHSELRDAIAIGVAGERVEVADSLVGAAAAGELRAKDTLILMCAAGEVDGENVRVLMTPPLALLLGAACGVTAAVLGKWLGGRDGES